MEIRKDYLEQQKSRYEFLHFLKISPRSATSLHPKLMFERNVVFSRIKLNRAVSFYVKDIKIMEIIFLRS